MLQRQTPSTVRSGMINLAFAVRDAVREDVARAFDYSNDSTKRFVSGAFRMQYRATGQKFTARIYPAGKSATLLGRHIELVNTVTVADRADLTDGDRMLIPSYAVKRNKRGTVPQAQQPGRILQRGANGRTRAFWTADGRVLMLRPTKKGDPSPAYAAKERTAQRRRIDVQASADRAVDGRAGAAFAEAIARQFKKIGVIK